MSATPDKATNPKNNSVQTFLTALALNTGILAIEVCAFTFLKTRYNRIYSPRTFLPPPNKRATELPKGAWRWIPTVLTSPSKDIIAKNGLDAYMFVRFLRLLVLIFAPFMLVTWVILLPANAVHIKSSSDGLARLSWGNIPKTEQKRYWAHLVVAYLLTFYVLWLLRREMLHFIHLRHQFLISKSHAKLAQAKTVLITSLAPDLSTEADLRQFASFVPGGIANVWIYRDAKVLNKQHKNRLAACKKLEKAECKLMREATKAWRVHWKLESKNKNKKGKGKEKAVAIGIEDSGSPNGAANPSIINDQQDVEKGSSNTPIDFLSKAPRPTHRLGKIPFIGQKVDTIDWCKSEIFRLSAEIEELRKDLPNRPPHGAAMIMCNLQMGAHVLAQCVSYHEPLMMVDKWIELAPEDIVWDNIDDGAYEVRARFILSWALTLGIVVLWSFPVAFSGTLSNIDQLCRKVHWLQWICNLPVPVPGIIQGVLPPLFLAILFAMLPFLLRGLAFYECIPRYSLISISVYKRYYLFLVIHGFLITTLSSGLTTAIPDIIEHPNHAVETLSEQLPSASTFFLTYVIANGFTASGAALLQLVPLALHYLKRIFFGNTPRQAYIVEFIMPKVDFGTTLPRVSLLATIAIAYSVISPLVCGFALVAFGLLLFAWKFLLTWVMDQPDAFETGGLYFPLAVSNLFVGLYVEQICLAGLFFLATADDGSRSSLPEGILMLVLLGITFGAQVLLRKSFDPITDYLPMSMATKDMAQRYARKQARKTRVPQGVLPSGLANDAEHIANAAFDLFSRDHVRSVVRRRLKLKPHPGENIGTAEDAGPSRATGSAGATTNGIEPSRRSDTASLNGSDRSKTHSKRSSRSTINDIAPPAPALKHEDGDSSSDEDEDIDEHAFDHPSTYTEAPWIWLPKDTLGMSDILLEELKEAKVNASDIGATMDEKARVRVQRNPPDEDWTYQDL